MRCDAACMMHDARGTKRQGSDVTLTRRNGGRGESGEGGIHGGTWPSLAGWCIHGSRGWGGGREGGGDRIAEREGGGGRDAAGRQAGRYYERRRGVRWADGGGREGSLEVGSIWRKVVEVAETLLTTTARSGMGGSEALVGCVREGRAEGGPAATRRRLVGWTAMGAATHHHAARRGEKKLLVVVVT